MTQPMPTRSVSPHQAVRAALPVLRKMRGWTADDLARECANWGMPALNRSVIANIESGRRKYVSIDELFCLAYVLNVAPVHLLIPIDDDADGAEVYAITPSVSESLHGARQWVRGFATAPGRDPRHYFAHVPAEEFDAAQRRYVDAEREITRNFYRQRNGG